MFLITYNEYNWPDIVLLLSKFVVTYNEYNRLDIVVVFLQLDRVNYTPLIADELNIL